MRLDTVNKWLTLVANFGVVAGLVFLGVEVQQNTTAVQASAIQQSVSLAREQILTLAADGDLNRLTLSEFDALSPEDQNRMFWLDRSFWFGMQGLYRQWRLGVLPDAEWLMWRSIMCSNYRGDPPGGHFASGGPALWELGRGPLIPEFADMIERDCPSLRAQASLDRPAEGGAEAAPPQ